MRCRVALLLLAAVLPRTILSQDAIDPAHQHSWGENIGWMVWRDAGDPPGTGGVRVHGTFLSGFVWSENAGWINLGDGAPADQVRYANAAGDDFGVNVDANGDLFGLAWGENIGWVQFDTRSLGSQRARLDRSARRFLGYVWGENVGWISLDDPERFVGLAAALAALFRRSDANGDASVDISDALHSLGCLFVGSRCTGCPDAGDSNDDGRFDIADPIHTLNWLFSSGTAPPAPGPFLCGPDPTTGDPMVDCHYEACP